MEARVVAAGRGWQWIVEGFALFRKSPAMWIALTILLVAASGWRSLILPVLGSLLFNLLSPVFLAGLMTGCRALESGEALEIRHLFAGFKQQAAPLVTSAASTWSAPSSCCGIVLLIAGGSMLPAVLSKRAATDIETLRAATRSLRSRSLVGPRSTSRSSC